MFALAAATAAAALPGRGENCDMRTQGRGECADGLICRREKGFVDVAVCQDPLKEGEECDGLDAGCDLGLRCCRQSTCPYNTCVRANELGDSCGWSSGCGNLALCSGSTCVEFLAEGDKCLKSSSCKNHLACYPDRCVPRHGEGYGCSSQTWCVE